MSETVSPSTQELAGIGSYIREETETGSVGISFPAEVLGRDTS